MFKKAKKPIIASVILLSLMIGIILLFFISAEPPEIVEDGIKNGIKTVSNGSVFISAKTIEHCYYKPDIDENGTLNDGYKICEAIVEGYNPNSYTLTVDKPGEGYSAYFMLDGLDKNKIIDEVKKDVIKGKKLFYCFSTEFELYNETISNITEVEDVGLDGEIITKLNVTNYTIERKRFINWQPLANDCKDTPPHNSPHFAYKVKFELLQYEPTTYNFSIHFKKEGGGIEIPIFFDIFLDPDISACGYLNTAGATYTQTANILDNALSVPCIIINASNITYDGGGYTIRSNDDVAGIYSNKINTTIKGTNITMGSGVPDGFGIWLSDADNSTIYNNILNDGFIGLYTTNNDYSNFTNNTANCNAYGIYLDYSDYNIVENNTANANTANAASILLSHSNYNNVTNNIANNNPTRDGIIVNGIYNVLENNTLFNNTYAAIDVQASSNIMRYNNITYITRGIYITGAGAADANYNKIIGNTISNSSSAVGGALGIVTESSASHTLIENNTLSDTRDNGIRLSMSTYVNVTNNTINFGSNGLTLSDSNYSRIVNNHFNNNTEDAIHFGNSNNNTIINIRVDTDSDTGSNGAIVFAGSSNNLFQDSIFNTTQTKIITLGGTSTNNTFLNCSYSAKETVAINNELLRKWYFDAQVNLTYNGTAVENANVSAYNSSNGFTFSVLSAADGSITQQQLIEYINTSTTAYHSNYTINASKTAWNPDNPSTHKINMTTNINQQFNIADYIVPYIKLDHPEAKTYSTNTSLSLNYTVSDSGRGIDSCWYNIYNSTGIVIANTTIASCLNTTFNISSNDVDYNLTLYSNDSANNINSSRVEFGIRMDVPSVVLDAPSDDSYLDNGTSVYFNFTSTDGDGLDTCKLWHNNTGTWHKNYTWIGPNSSVMNYTTANLSENSFIWNVWCNDTTSKSDWALNNFTLTVDETNPNVTITTANETTVTGLSITIGYNISDTNIDSCYFTLRTSGGLLHNYPENTSLDCSLTSRSISTTSYGTFVVQFWGEDKAGNLGDANLTFTTIAPVSGNGGGGGGAAEEVEEPEVEKTFCGDGVCQPEGNDYGVKEDFWNCPTDCKGFNLDLLFYSFTKYCFDNDPTTICFWSQMMFTAVPLDENITIENVTIYKDGQVCYMGVCEGFNMDTLVTNCFKKGLPCFWRSNVAFLSLFGIGAIGLGLSMVRIRAPGKKTKISPYKYIRLKIKKRKWRR